MTNQEREYLRDARRHLRYALAAAGNEDWSSVVRTADRIYRQPVVVSKVTLEVKDLLASLVTLEPSQFRGNAAMRAAAVTRLKEVHSLIGESLVATTDHRPLTLTPNS